MPPLPPPATWTTRFAPAPTGLLHLGHAVNAVWVWGLAGAFGGRVLLRVEDHDRRRSRRRFERSLLDDLDWLGLEPDEPPTAAFRRGGPLPWRQSDRGARYAAALADLAAAGRVYACRCSRRQIEAAGGRRGDELCYPGTCREAAVDPEETPMRRVRLEREEVRFDDLLLGPQVQVPAEQCGDLPARDRDGNWTYAFAVVVDDLDQGVDLVVRGADLLAATGRQMQLAALLGRPRPPRVLHHPLVLRPDGTKLSKANRDTGLADLRRAGWTAARVLGAAARLAGLRARSRPLAAADLPALVAETRPELARRLGPPR